MDSIIFDLDGTLWDSTDGVVKSWNEIILKKNRDDLVVTSDTLKDLFGLQLNEIADEIFSTMNKDDRYKLINECCENENLYLSNNGGILYEDLKKTLEDLHKRYKLYIVSNCQRGYIESFIKAHNMAEFFDDFECNGNTGLSKAKCISLIIKRNNLSSPIYVGDTQRDLESSEESHVPFVYASYGFGDVTHYDYKIDKFSDLSNLNVVDKYRDGHIHSMYCPHGSGDSFEKCIDFAIKNHFREISFTEHMDYTFIFTDIEFMKDIAPSKEIIMKYFQDIDNMKKKYDGIIKINKGLEVDYIDGYEEEIKKSLDEYGDNIEDSLLSVHFVKYDGIHYAVDYLDDFERLIKKIDSIEKIYDLYYETVIKCIESDLGKHKPTRIGHISLIRRFNEKYPFEYKNIEMYQRVIDALINHRYEIDFNTAGLRKEFCNETYPSGIFLKMIRDNNIPMVYGSDAHNAYDIGKDFV